MFLVNRLLLISHIFQSFGNQVMDAVRERQKFFCFTNKEVEPLYFIRIPESGAGE